MRHPWRGFLGVPGRLNHPGPTPIMSDSMEVGSVEVLAGGVKLRWVMVKEVEPGNFCVLKNKTGWVGGLISMDDYCAVVADLAWACAWAKGLA